VTFAPGHVGQAFALNGSNTAVNAGNATNLQVSGGDFTVEAWVYYSSLFNADAIVCLASGCDMSIVDKMQDISLPQSNANGWRLLKQAANYFLFCFGGGAVNRCGRQPEAANNSVFSPIGSVAANTWYHIAAVKGANTISLYVNGLLAGQTTLGPFTDTNATGLLIGAKNSIEGAHTNGLVDEVTLYNRALSLSEIQAIFAAGGSGKYKFTPVTIVVKPGSSPPVFTRNEARVIRVAILSNPGFDARQVNPKTIRLAGATLDLLGHDARCQTQDVNGDGIVDLVCDVRTREDFLAGTTFMVMEAKLFTGEAVRGQQEIQITGRQSEDRD
jgi:Concanavalin A-like lectin/glucanases superfamily